MADAQRPGHRHKVLQLVALALAQVGGCVGQHHAPQVALQRRQQRLRIWAKAAVKRWVSGRPAGTILPDTVPEKIGITPLDAVVATAVGSKCVRMLSRTPCFPRLNTKVRGSGFLAESVPSVTCVRFFFCVWEACVGA